jgi:predicted MFS family arabinose efflux permease
MPVTWLLVIPYFFCGFTDIGLIQTHLVPLLESREWSNAMIANAVLVFGLFNILGTACIGWLTDTVSVKKIIVFLFALRICGLMVLNFNGTSAGLIIFSVLYGLTDIASIAPFTMLCSKIFGAERMGTSFGLISFFHQFGAAAGSFIPGVLFQFSADYASTLWLSAGMLVVSVLMITAVKEKKQARPAGARQTADG